MEISENEENDVKPPLPPMPHPDDEPRLQEQKWPNGELYTDVSLVYNQLQDRRMNSN